MEVINITDRIQLKTLKYKIDRLQAELLVYEKTITNLRNENQNLFSKNMLLQEENDELKRLLKEFKVDITYG